MEKFTMTVKGETWAKFVIENPKDYGILSYSKDLKGLRRQIKILMKMGLENIWQDIIIVKNSNFSLWGYGLGVTSLSQWEGKSSYYAGMIYAYERLKGKKFAER